MKYPYVFVLTLFLGLYSYGQKTFKKAEFKLGNPHHFLAETFTQLSGTNNKGKGTIIISFTLTKDGQIKKPFPIQFDNQKNAINAILAIQKTKGMWLSTKVNNRAKDQKYKIAFNFIAINSTYETDVKMADKFAEKKMYKKALKYYNRAIESNKHEAELYLKRAEVKYALKDMDGLKEDYLICKQLQQEILANVQLSVVQTGINNQLSYIDKEK